jgi:hypothetical protein
MKQTTQASSKTVVRCAPDKHDWQFFDSFPDHEIFECRICRQKKFVDLKTGKQTLE